MFAALELFDRSEESEVLCEQHFQNVCDVFLGLGRVTGRVLGVVSCHSSFSCKLHLGTHPLLRGRHRTRESTTARKSATTLLRLDVFRHERASFDTQPRVLKVIALGRLNRSTC